MQQNAQYTVVAGTPVNLATGSTRVPTLGDAIFARQVFIEMLPASGAGVGYVMDGVVIGRTPATSNASDVSAVLTAATASAPGAYPYTKYAIGGGGPDRSMIPIHEMWIDGAHSGDVILVSFERSSS